MAAVRSNIVLRIGVFFGVSVSVLTAIEDDTKAVGLNTLCIGKPLESTAPHAPARCRQDLKCVICGNTDKETFKKGQERADGTFAIVDAEAVAAAIAASDDVKNSLTLTTHPVEQVAEQTLPSGKVYYLEAVKGGAASYALIVEAVRRRPNIAFCTIWAARTVPAMYRLGVYRDSLTLTQLAWPASVKAAPGSAADTVEAEVEMALLLVDQLCSDFDPETFRDTRTETLAAYIAAAEGVEGATRPETLVVASKVTSMMELLTAAVAASSAPGVATKPKRSRKPKAGAEVLDLATAPRKRAAVRRSS